MIRIFMEKEEERSAGPTAQNRSAGAGAGAGGREVLYITALRLFGGKKAQFRKSRAAQGLDVPLERGLRRSGKGEAGRRAEGRMGGASTILEILKRGSQSTKGARNLRPWQRWGVRA